MLRSFPKGRRKTEIVLEINELHFSGSKAHWGMLSLMHMGYKPRPARVEKSLRGVMGML